MAFKESSKKRARIFGKTHAKVDARNMPRKLPRGGNRL